MFRNKAIKYSSKTIGKFDTHLFEYVLMRAEEENEYWTPHVVEKGSKISCRSGSKIAIGTNVREKPERIFDVYKLSNEVE